MRLWVRAGLLAGTVMLGLGVRFAHVGLPWGVSKYGGSALWALAVYWVVSWLVPGRAGVLASLAVTAGVEVGKLWHTAGLDGFRETIWGKLLLGRVFSWWDIAAYWLAIGLAAGLEGWIRMKRARGERHPIESKGGVKD